VIIVIQYIFWLLSADLHHGEFFWGEVRPLTDNFLEWEIRKKYFLKIAHFLLVYVGKYFVDINFLPYESKSFFRCCRWGIWKISKYRRLIQMIWKKYLFLKMLTLPIVLFKNEWSWTYIVVGWPLGRWDFWKKSKKIELSTHIKVIFNNLWYQIFDRVFLKKKDRTYTTSKKIRFDGEQTEKNQKLFEKFFTTQIYRE
jgi:hypothetical protein